MGKKKHLQQILPSLLTERHKCAHTHSRAHTKTPQHLNIRITFTKSAERRVQGCDGADRLGVNTDKSHRSQRDVDAVLYLPSPSFFAR